MASTESFNPERSPLLASYVPKTADEFDDNQSDSHTHTTARLYLSHFLSTWNSRVFEFGGVLYLARIFPGTLVPMSLYALIRGVSAIVFAPFVGMYIDTANRLQVVTVSIVFQRLAVAISCVVFYMLAQQPSPDLDGKNGLLAVLAVLACVEKLCSIMNSVSVEKDWVVIVAKKDQGVLRAMNSQMWRIDLLCKILGPLVIVLIDGVSTNPTTVVIFATNISSLWVELYAMAQVYHDMPKLQEPEGKDPSYTANSFKSASDVKPNSKSDRLSPRWLIRDRDLSDQFTGDFSLYFRHRVFLPSFALALLNSTVLNFGAQMITYLLTSGYSSTQVGIARTFGVVLEILATWLAPWMIGMIGPDRAGLWLSFWQVTMLTAGTMVFFLATSELRLSAAGLVLGVILSRLGLRGLGLCIQLIVQEGVEAESRGAFSSIEAAFQSFFELSAYGSTLFFSSPDQFRWPALISTIAVALASIAYTIFICKEDLKR